MTVRTALSDDLLEVGSYLVAAIVNWRSGRYGERDTWALQNGVTGGGWKEVPDLTGCTSREAVGAA